MNKKSTRYSPEVMERALRMVEESASQHDSQCCHHVHRQRERLDAR